MVICTTAKYFNITNINMVLTQVEGIVSLIAFRREIFIVKMCLFFVSHYDFSEGVCVKVSVHAWFKYQLFYLSVFFLSQFPKV